MALVYSGHILTILTMEYKKIIVTTYVFTKFLIDIFLKLCIHNIKFTKIAIKVKKKRLSYVDLKN